MRKLAHIARTYDRGYGHFTTRQNIQFNWPKLQRRAGHPRPSSPSVEMHAHPDLAATASATSPPTISPAPPPTRSPIRAPMPKSSANGRRCIRNSRFLPRKFKIAVTGAPSTTAPRSRSHDIGLQLKTQRRRARSASTSMSAAAWAARR